MINNNIAVILVAPQLGENIGASARAMKNFGLAGLIKKQKVCLSEQLI